MRFIKILPVLVVMLLVAGVSVAQKKQDKTLGMISPFASIGRARIIPDGVRGKEY